MFDQQSPESTVAVADFTVTVTERIVTNTKSITVADEPVPRHRAIKPVHPEPSVYDTSVKLRCRCESIRRQTR